MSVGLLTYRGPGTATIVDAPHARVHTVDFVEPYGPASAYHLAKRTLDVLVASVALLVAVPIMLLIALAIWLDSRGPILFRQERVGRYGRLFTMYKFRTMRPDPPRSDTSIEAPEPHRLRKSARDPRITRVGRFLRRTSLDELPQLLNVLRGEMSLVGPRPELPAMLTWYRAEHYVRHAATPGLTGWWQVRGRRARRSETDPIVDLARKVADDGYYVANRSLALDLWILVLTIEVVLSGRGSY